MESLRSIDQSTVLSIILGAIGVGLTIYQLFRPVGVRLYYEIVAVKEIECPPPFTDIDLRVGDRHLNRLSYTSIALWNGGYSATRRGDIVASDLLRIVFPPGTEIVRAEVSRMSRKATEVKASRASSAASELLITYEILERRDGAVIDILHTAAEPWCGVTGSVVGQPEGPIELRARFSRARLATKARKATFARLLTSLTFGYYAGPFWLFIVTLAFIALGTFAVILAPGYDVNGQYYVPASLRTRSVGAAVSSIYMLLGLTFMWMSRQRHPPTLNGTPNRAMTA